eukprot:GEMP01017719.1.p1 GENE.GEMP01017719.1~~GEMP01017719.1.p1  ORF type:complete len:245 (+),score=33.87 GEMP01017719.1:349-1083(+)
MSKKGEGKGNSKASSRNSKGGKGRGSYSEGDQKNYQTVKQAVNETPPEVKAQGAPASSRWLNSDPRNNGVDHSNDSSASNVDDRQQHNNGNRDDKELNDTADQIREIGKDFSTSLEKLGGKNDEKFDLIFAILSDLQGRQKALEDTVRRLQTHRREAPQQQTQAHNSYVGYCSMGMTMPQMISGDDAMVGPMNMGHTNPGVYIQDTPHNNGHRSMKLLPHQGPMMSGGSSDMINAVPEAWNGAS